MGAAGLAGLDREREAATESRVAERRQEQAGVETAPPDSGQLDSAQLDGGRRLPFDPRMLLGLQATAGNAAVSSLIAQAREPAAAHEPPAAEAADMAANGPPPAESAGAEASTAGVDDDSLAVLDAEAEPGNAGADAETSKLSSASSDEYAGGPAASGVAIEERTDAPAPSLDGLEPEQALGVASGLPPRQLLAATSGVGRAVDRTGAIEQERLSREPPSRPRHPGAPSTVESPASERVGLGEGGSARAVTRVPRGHEVRVPATTPLPPAPALPAALGVEPVVTGGEGGELSADDGQKLASAIARLPGGDVGLRIGPGPVPPVPAAGNADPNQVHAQQAHMEEAINAEHAQGRREAGLPLGEDEIYPVAAAEVLTGRVEMSGASAEGAEGSAEGETDDAVSMIAQQERGTAIQAATGAGISELASERQLYADRTVSERATAESEMSGLERANFGEQAAERGTARAEVGGLRDQWSREQQDLVARGRAEGDATARSAVESAVATRTQAEAEAAAHYREGREEADAARREGERHAVEERQKAQSRSSGGFLGLLASAARSVFDAARSAVQAAFERARQLVRSAIERAQQLAQAVIERARQAIVAAIQVAGDALTAIGDRVLAAFPVLRNRFRQLIRDRVARAEAAVNRLSMALRQAIQTALNLLGRALAAAVARLRSGMQAVVSRVRSAIQAAVDFARSAVAGLGTFAVLVRDVAANPGRWLANLAAAAQDGIRNHLWPDLKLAVQGWFSDKVESVVGLGQAAWSLLRKGGITVMQVAGVAWEGLQSLIPPTIVWILIEKLVALIVPAAAAVMLIIQALQAVWGSVGRIIQAFDAFMAFLKGVRWGNAGPLFGKAVAAGAVAVIEFVSQFLLQRLMGGAGKVASKLRALAKRIGKRLVGFGRASIGLGKTVGQKLGSAGKRLLAKGERIVGERGGARGQELEAATVEAGGRRIRPGHEFAEAADFTIVEPDGSVSVRHGPLNPGPLHSRDEEVLHSFRSDTYTARTLGGEKDLFRVYSDPRKKLGAYWTDIPPSGPLQSTIDAALLPSFGNQATQVVHIRVPAGETLFEGFAAEQAEEPGVRLLGGGRQIVLDNIRADWEVD